MTYIYVRKDLTFLEPQSQALLVAFLKSLYMESFVQQCVDDYEFSLVVGNAKTIAEQAINSLITSAAAVPFTFEEGTELYAGAGDYVISAKRKSAMEVEADKMAVENEALKARISALEQQLKQAVVSIATIESQIGNIEMTENGGRSTMSSGGSSTGFMTALAMTGVSMIFMFCGGV